MNFKKTITMIAAASTVAVSGVTFAQYITSTPGSGATATCNTLRGGTGAHRPDPNACAPKVAPIAAIERVEPVAVIEPAPVTAQAPAIVEMGAPPAPEVAPSPEPLPARADRG